MQLNQPFTVTAYRGVHGDPNVHPLETRLGCLSFSTPQVAQMYATQPNCHQDVVHTPRVVKAEINLNALAWYRPDDPFIDVKLLNAIFSDPQITWKLISPMAGHIANTDRGMEIIELYERPNDSIEDTLERLISNPRYQAAWEDLYLNAYLLLDRVEFVNALMSLGYDGAVHAGSGLSMQQPEYKVFEKCCVKITDTYFLHRAKSPIDTYTPM
ncbi:hypothetical protein AB6D11_00720 [Vibrio splendidus]